MIDLFEMMRQAQGGAAFDNIARAYGLSPEQIRAAAAALTPAYAQGLQRQAQSDHAARRIQELLGAETYARAFETQAAALDPNAKAAGDDALGALFGSKEVSRAVAAQASAASGVQAEIIRKVLPVLTSILIGGFMKASRNAGAQPGGFSGTGGAPFPGPFGEFWGQILGGLAGPGAANPAPETRRGESDAPKNPFEEWMGGFGQSPQAEPAPEAERRTTGNPMGDAVQEMLEGMFGGGAARQTEAPQPEQPRQERPAEERAAEVESPVDQWVRTGREVSNQNARAMEQIFDAFFGGNKKTGG